MLVLSRKIGEFIDIGRNISIEIVDLRRDKVRLGITAPPRVPVNRREVTAAIAAEGAKKRVKKTGSKSTEGK